MQVPAAALGGEAVHVVKALVWLGLAHKILGGVKSSKDIPAGHWCKHTFSFLLTDDASPKLKSKLES